MISRFGFPRGLLYVLISALLIGVSHPALASSRSCEYLLSPVQPVTLKALRERNTQHLQDFIKQHPQPGFDNLADEVKKEQVGEIGPRALQQIFGTEFSFVSTPAPSAPMDTAVNSHDEGKSFPVHVDVDWYGRRTSTTVFASLPKTVVPSESGYLVGPEYPVVVVHLHGGGTPTATGKNGMSIGLALAAQGIPVLAPDLPGHGAATRKIDGFTTFQNQIDWLLKIVDKLVDPKVRVVISGHSWGGEFAAYMHRLAKTGNPKYAHLERFITLSPPVDVSLGGDESLKIEQEHWFQENYQQFEAQAAPADFEFYQNSVRNGKISLVGSIFTALTSMDYQLPPLTPEQRARLKPNDVVEGSADILTWLGREKQGRQSFGADLIELGPGMTWKSKGPDDLYPTGHNIWDVLINGTKTPFTYDLMIKRALEVAGSKGMGEDHADAATAIVSEMFRNYANFFLFRQMINRHEEYVPTPTADRTNLAQRRMDLDGYIRGIKDAMNVSRAQQELAIPPLTEARRQELQNYLQQINSIDQSFTVNSFSDSVFESEISSLNQEFADLLGSLGIGQLADYKAALDQYLARKGHLTPQEQKIRGALTRLDQKYLDASKQKLARFAQAREARIRALKSPAGVTDQKSAQRELNVDQSPERLEQLKAFVSRATSSDGSVRQQAVSDWQTYVANQNKPAGIVTLEQAMKEKADLDALTDSTYAPPGDPEIAPLAAEVKRLADARQAIYQGSDKVPSLDRFEKQVKSSITRRTTLSKSWESLWKKGILSSDKIVSATQLSEQKLKTYTDVFHDLEYKKGLWLLQLKNSGQLNEASILASTPELKSQSEQMLARKAEFEAQRDALADLRWNEALAGNLQGPSDSAKSATQIAQELWGKSISEPSPDSLVMTIRNQETQLESLRRQYSVLAQELDRAKWEYNQKMVANGHKVPLNLARISIREQLDLSYNDLVERLREDPVLMQAFRSTMEEWNSFLATLRVEAQTKDAGNY